MYLQDYKIVGVGPCLAEGTQFRVTALLSCDISEMMPYLNAVLKFCTYEPFESTLTFKCKGSPVVLHPDRVTVGQLREVDSAEAILDAIVEFVNRVHGQRESLKPEFMLKDMKEPMRIYTLLPQTNCGDCGETCTAFTVKLIKGEKRVEECSHLSSGQAAEAYVILEKMDEGGTILLNNGQ